MGRQTGTSCNIVLGFMFSLGSCTLLSSNYVSTWNGLFWSPWCLTQNIRCLIGTLLPTEQSYLHAYGFYLREYSFPHAFPHVLVCEYYPDHVTRLKFKSWICFYWYKCLSLAVNDRGSAWYIYVKQVEFYAKVSTSIVLCYSKEPLLYYCTYNRA